VKSWTAADAAVAQSQDLGVHTKDLYGAIERGDHPSWELHVQQMSDEEHPELDFDPLDDTKVWPENDFPLRKVGTMTLNRVPDNFFLQSEQIAFGTGVLVDGLDFSDDKMLVGRTFSYSDTQRYRVGPNYLQLGVNAPRARVATNQRDGQMAYGVDLGEGQNPHVNYEPSILGGLREDAAATPDEIGPEITGRLTRKRIPRTDDYTQAGQRYLLSEPWEQDDLVTNFVGALSQCDRPIAERMVWHLFMAEDELGRRVGEGLGITADDVRGLEPLQTQTLTEAELERAANLGKNGPRDVTGLVMTHCVPNEHVSLT
jgi:catalase